MLLEECQGGSSRELKKGRLIYYIVMRRQGGREGACLMYGIRDTSLQLPHPDHPFFLSIMVLLFQRH